MTEYRDHYQDITNKVIALLEQGKIPWKKTWNGEHDIPTSLATKKFYRGINHVLLSCNYQFTSPYYLSYNEAKSRGGHVKRGEKGFPVYFWKYFAKLDKENNEVKQIPFLRNYTVFNLEQTEDVKFQAPNPTENTNNPIELCDRIVEGYKGKPKLEHHGDKACYIPALDKVIMPRMSTFEGSEQYYQTLFHEFSHSTGHKNRLNRFDDDRCLGYFGSPGYAREELVAELSSSFLCSEAHIDNAILTNTAAYIQSWLSVLQKDKKMIVWSAGRAQKSADYVLGRKEEYEDV